MLFAFVIALGPVAILIAVEAIVGLAINERVRGWVHLAFVAGLALLIALHALRSVLDWQGALLLVAALAVAGGVAYAFSRSRNVREWVRWLSALPIILVVLFLVFSPTADLVRGGSEPARIAVTVKTHRNVVVLLLDEFPVLSLMDANGHIDARRLPNFAQLASESRWYRNATAVGTHTWFAMPAVMTGRYPPDHPAGGPTYADYPDSIFRLLGSEYPSNVSEVETRLCAAHLLPQGRHRRRERRPGAARPRRTAASARCSHAARGQYAQMVALHDSHDLAEGDAVEQVGNASSTSTTPPVSAPLTAPTIPKSERAAVVHAMEYTAQPGRFADWMAGITAKEPPSLNLIHLLLPHYPWLHTASGRSYTEPHSAGDGFAAGLWKTATAAAVARRQHLLQVGYVDRLLGTLVARSRRRTSGTTRCSWSPPITASRSPRAGTSASSTT